MGPTSHSYISQRIKLHYVDWGNPKAPPLLLIHGGRDHCRNWDWVAEELRQDWHVIAPDLRGHGDSTGDWVSFGAEEGHDISALMNQLSIDKYDLMGFSLGASAGLHLSLIHI